MLFFFVTRCCIPETLGSLGPQTLSLLFALMLRPLLYFVQSTLKDVVVCARVYIYMSLWSTYRLGAYGAVLRFTTLQLASLFAPPALPKIME